MASIQYERTEEFSYEDKERLDELVKKAQSLDIKEQALAIVAKNEGLDKAAAPNLIHVCMVGGALASLTRGSLDVTATKTWAGYTVEGYSNPLRSGGGFAMAGCWSGVKAAVVYTGKNDQGVDCGWLLAFSDTSEGRNIYAEVGRKEKFNNIDWSRVEQKLDNASIAVNAYDNETGTRLVGTIVYSSFLHGSAVAASLSG